MVLNTTLFKNVSEITDWFIDGKISSTLYENPRITRVGQYVFGYCGFTELYLPHAYSFSEGAFHACTTVQKFTLDWSAITTLPSYAFRNCYVWYEDVEMPNCSMISTQCFQSCSSLKTVSFENCTTIQAGAFSSCTKLSYAYFPKATTMQNNAFRNTQLKSIHIPLVGAITQSAFQYCGTMNAPLYLNRCNTIQSVAFHSCHNLPAVYMNWSQTTAAIQTSAFFWCTHLLSLYLLGPAVPTLQNVNAFNSTPISTYTTSTGGVRGKIYVPSSLYASYIAATGWSTYQAVIYSLTSTEVDEIITMMKGVSA